MNQDSLFNNRKSQIDGYFQSSYFGLIGIEYEGEDLVVKNKQASLAALKATQKLLFGSNLDESEIAELGDNRSTIFGFLQSSNQAIKNNTFIFQGYAPEKELMIQYFNEKINEKIAIISSSDFTHTQLSRLSKKVENLKIQLLETKDENKKPKILDDIKEQNNATLDILFDEYTKNYKKIPKEILTGQHNLSQEKEAQKELTREEFERVLKEEYIPERNEFKGNFESNIALNVIKNIIKILHNYKHQIQKSQAPIQTFLLLIKLQHNEKSQAPIQMFLSLIKLQNRLKIL
jgi:hypothetical protein